MAFLHNIDTVKLFCGCSTFVATGFAQMLALCSHFVWFTTCRAMHLSL